MEHKKSINVLIWNEFHAEKNWERAIAAYPDGIHHVIASHLKRYEDMQVTTATLDQPEFGLTDSVINSTDVLIWYGHSKHDLVPDEIVDKLIQKIYDGMGFIALHSSLGSKLFRRLMGTSCRSKWREADEKERLWVVKPSHPIVAGIDEYFELAPEEMYGEYWDIPDPEEIILISWFEGGEVMRSGITYTRGKGKIFYFRPGHQEYPTFYNESVNRIIGNAVRWAAPPAQAPAVQLGNVHSLEPIGGAFRDGRGNPVTSNRGGSQVENN